jgi:cytochrome c-type biogenesis protein CcmE
MKKVHIVAILVIALAIGAIMGTVADSSTYANFKTAAENQGEEYHVVGYLDKNEKLNYDPTVNANLFTFTMIDKEGKKSKVFFNGSKPQDFERSEQIVLTGKMKDNNFYASKILMKCPSKYNNGGAVEVKEVRGA